MYISKTIKFEAKLQNQSGRISDTRPQFHLTQFGLQRCFWFGGYTWALPSV